MDWPLLRCTVYCNIFCNIHSTAVWLIYQLSLCSWTKFNEMIFFRLCDCGVAFLAKEWNPWGLHNTIYARTRSRFNTCAEPWTVSGVGRIAFHGSFRDIHSAQYEWSECQTRFHYTESIFLHIAEYKYKYGVQQIESLVTRLVNTNRPGRNRIPVSPLFLQCSLPIDP